VRVVVALGGNALLRRGEELTAENQQANARIACRAIAPLALEHDLVVSHRDLRHGVHPVLNGAFVARAFALLLAVGSGALIGMIGMIGCRSAALGRGAHCP
jgi:carbamate kinase